MRTTSPLHESTRASLLGEPKELPAVWLYDRRGSDLYEAITRLPEYYLPQREAEILRARAGEIAASTRALTLVELGPGAAKNTRILLDSLPLERFVPIDVSETALDVSAIEAAYPKITVEAVVADFERDLLLPHGERRLVALLGSTIGNLDPERRVRLLERVAAELAEDEALLVGFDLVMDPSRLEAAYDDPGGVTEAFLRNALTHVNRKLEANFDQRRFRYEARWDAQNEWMDIGFRACEAHTVVVRAFDLELELAEGEFLRVEISSKFRRDQVEREASRAGLGVKRWWTDTAADFALALLSL